MGTREKLSLDWQLCDSDRALIQSIQSKMDRENLKYKKHILVYLFRTRRVTFTGVFFLSLKMLNELNFTLSSPQKNEYENIIHVHNILCICSYRYKNNSVQKIKSNQIFEGKALYFLGSKDLSCLKEVWLWTMPGSMKPVALEW